MNNLLLNENVGNRSYGCLMMNIENNSPNKLIEFSKKMIPDSILYIDPNDPSFGREKKMHVTCKYGFAPDLTKKDIASILQGISKPFNIKLISLSLFDNNEDYDVVKFDVEQSDILKKLRKRCDKFPNEDKYDEYHAHVTLGYVKKGTFPHKKENLNIILPITSFTYSPSGNKKKIHIKLNDINIIKEDPDDIIIKGKTVTFSDGIHTFMIYDDIVDKKQYWVDYNIKNDVILCENKEVENEIYSITQENINKVNLRLDPVTQPNIVLYGKQNMERYTYFLYDHPSHLNLISVLALLRRCKLNRNKVHCDGRVFNVSNTNYFTFWPEKSKIIPFKSHIDNFLHRVNISTNDVLFETIDDSNFITYTQYFKNKEKTPELTSTEKQILQIKKDLHVNKGKLDQSILKALQSNPKDIDTLYSRLEKQFNMPISKIKQLYGNVPLDKLLKESNITVMQENTTNLLYYVAKKSDLPLIKEHGILPQVPKDYEERCGRRGVYLFKSKQSVDDAMTKWWGNRLVENDNSRFDEGEDLVLLSIDPNGLSVKPSTMNYELISDVYIPYSNIKKIEDIG